MELPSLRSFSPFKLQNFCHEYLSYLQRISILLNSKGVWRKVIEVQPLSSPLQTFAVHGFTLVNGSFIDNHDAWA